MQITLADARTTESLGGALAGALPRPALVFLQGELGAGKTTVVRGLLRALGHPGTVKSPTYTLVEPYSLASGPVYHFDLYRLAEADELAELGIRDYFDDAAICLVEWPERGEAALPTADLHLLLTVAGTARLAQVTANTPEGERALQGLEVNVIF